MNYHCYRDTARKVNFDAKVLTIKPSITVGQDVQKRIQKISIADQYNHATLQLWEDDINTLKPDTSYLFTNITVSEFRQEKYFTFSTGASAQEIPDIEEVTDITDDNDVYSSTKECDFTIVAGIMEYYQQSKCISRNCKGKLQLSEANIKLATCETCGMIQRMDECEKTLNAKLVLRLKGKRQPPTTVTLYANGTNLSANTKLPQHEITKEALLLAEPFGVTYRGSTLTGVYHKE